MDKKAKKNHGYLKAVLNNKCPHCRQGSIFSGRNAYHLRDFMKMNEYCPVCGQATELEKGFYYGTGYVSYAITVAFSVSTFIAWCVLAGISFKDNSIFWWLGTNIILLVLLQPYFMRLSRTVWLSFFVKYDPVRRSGKSKTH